MWLSSRSGGYALAAAAVVLAAIPFAGVVLRRIEATPLAPRSREPAVQTAPRVEQAAREAMNERMNVPPARSADDAPALAPDVPTADDTSESGMPEFSESEDLATRQALDSDPTRRQAIADSIRRAAVIARSTAARLYGTGDSATDAGNAKPDLADAALAEVARGGGALDGLDAADEVAAPTDTVAHEGERAERIGSDDAEPVTSPEPAKVVKIDAGSATVDADGRSRRPRRTARRDAQSPTMGFAS